MKYVPNVVRDALKKKGENLPEYWGVNGQMYEVYDGDLSDVRFYDPKNVIIGLRAKGAAKNNNNDFIVHV